MSDTLYAVLIQIDGDSLLLPNAAVSEVSALDRFEPPEPGTPPWLAGWHATAERRVPVLSFEVLSGRPMPEIGKRGRVVIVNPIGQRIGAGGFALLAQGHPHLISLTPNSILSQNLLPGDREELILARARMGAQEALIPDLEQIESHLAGMA